MINTESLRNKILDLAIQGKLTEQLPEDGNAEDLYAQIQEEKQKLIAEGKIKKEKPLPEIEEDEAWFEVPPNWKKVRLNDICRITMGQSPDGATLSSDESGVEFHQGKVYFSDYIINKSDVYTSDPRKIAEEDSVLLCVRAPVGDVNIANRSICIGRGLCALKGYKNIRTKYILYALKGQKRRFESKSKGATFEAITNDDVKKQVIALPPLKEQNRIVNKVDVLFDLIDKIDELQSKYNADVEVLKGKIIDAGIQGKLTKQLPEDGNAEDLYARIQEEKQKLMAVGKIKKEKPLPEIKEDDIPFEIPRSWKWVRWGEVVNIVSARRVHQSDWRKEGIPFYRAREIAKLADDGYVDNELFISNELFEEFSKTGVPQPGDLIVSAVGTLGKTYIVKEGDVFYYKDASVICFENFGRIVPEYLKYVMESSLMEGQIGLNSGGTTVDTLTMVRMNNYLLLLPPIDEQYRIVKIIDETLQAIER